MENTQSKTVDFFITRYLGESPTLNGVPCTYRMTNSATNKYCYRAWRKHLSAIRALPEFNGLREPNPSN